MVAGFDDVIGRRIMEAFDAVHFNVTFQHTTAGDWSDYVGFDSPFVKARRYGPQPYQINARRRRKGVFVKY
jgi:hypothetical protein